MTLQALLVSKDDQASGVLSRALAGFGIAVERLSDPEVAISRMGEQRFDQVVVDFEAPESAAAVLECLRNLSAGRTVATLALVNSEGQIRETFGAGANFVLVKPVSDDKALATLRAATALLKRERRRAFRVPVQAPVSLSVPGGQEMEGIMLDLSETGMDVLASQPLTPPSLVAFRFSLPDGSLSVEAHGEVAWANPNGQSGIHFLDVTDDVRAQLHAWVSANAAPEEAEPVSRCKLTDLSLGGCYVETESPFPERALVDLCLRAGELEIHAEGLVRVMHPSHGMGIEFPSRTSEQRQTVEDFIHFLTSRPGTMPELLISPQKMVADLAEFPADNASADDSHDPLLELLRNGHALSCQEFASELRKQRSSEEVASS